MPAIADALVQVADVATRTLLTAPQPELVRRVKIPVNSSSPPGLQQTLYQDPWSKSGKYALGWVFFSIILLVCTSLVRFYHLFTDRVRTALHAEEVYKSSATSSPDTDYELSVLDTDKSTHKFFPRAGPLPTPPKRESSVGSFSPIYKVVALFRFVFYRPIPSLRLRKGWRPFNFPPLAAAVLVVIATAFVTLYCFLPQPLFRQSIAFGSPPLAIRAGMLAVAMMPWIIALSLKANFISLLTGIGHERLNVLHRWAAYLCLFLSLIHTIPFYLPRDQTALSTFKSYFAQSNSFYIYGTGVAALVPLAVLCLHSLPILRQKAHELFVTLHVPIAIVYLAMLFWHCHNYLTSWNYLFATLAIWLASYLFRLTFLNWAKPWRMSWLIGDEAALTVISENAIKVTIPTQMRWQPGQYVYLRMPGISVFENHPFTIASLCSDDFPSEYGEGYRDMVLVFRPFGGFTRKVLDKAIEKGPWHTYRAFLDGPYGGMKRRLEAFDNVVLIAGGSGITAIVSQLLDLIKRMRDGKAITKNVQVIWALKRPETMDWFREELRICREFAPPDTVHCQFYITAAKRVGPSQLISATTPGRPVSMVFHDKVNEAFQGIADKRLSWNTAKRNSALIHDVAAGDTEREKELRRENEDMITALPMAHVMNRPTQHLAPPPSQTAYQQQPQSNLTALPSLPHRNAPNSLTEKRRSPHKLSLDISNANASAINATTGQPNFDFGFPSTPTEFQKNLMRFAFLPAASKKRDGWSTEYGRPDLPYMMREMSSSWGRRTCVFVCGPPSMREGVSKTVASLQSEMVLSGKVDEVFLHAENYAI